jgi:hypothetical protein
MEVIESELEKDCPQDSVFKLNTNPIRVGLLMYKAIDDIENQFSYSQFASEIAKK